MPLILHQEITALQRRMLDLGARVGEAVRGAISALETHDLNLASRIDSADSEIDAEEVALEEACLKVLALHQPVAVDLRLIIAILKINNDLERIGDLAVYIARRVRPQTDAAPASPPQLSELATRAVFMVDGALDAFVRMDRDAARNLCHGGETFGRAYDALYRAMTQTLRETRDAESIDAALEYIIAGRSLQRICDHATNIAEDVVYMLDGIVVRHNHGSF
jgi:phosphate transport system regulatory protein PhoU